MYFATRYPCRNSCVCTNSPFPYHSILEQENTKNTSVLNLETDIFRSNRKQHFICGLVSVQRHDDCLVVMADMLPCDYVRPCFLRLRGVCQYRWFGWQCRGPGRTSRSHELIRFPQWLVWAPILSPQILSPQILPPSSRGQISLQPACRWGFFPWFLVGLLELAGTRTYGLYEVCSHSILLV